MIGNPHLEFQIGYAKAAFDAGNELAALDAQFLCSGITSIPPWAADLSVDLNSARHRKVKRGPNTQALRFTINQMNHLERYAASMVALLRDRVLPRDTGPLGDAVYARAAELIGYNGKYWGTESIRKSQQRVDRDMKAGNGIAYWHPSSHELSDFMPWREGCWLSHLMLVQKSNTWHFVYLRE